MILFTSSQVTAVTSYITRNVVDLVVKVLYIESASRLIVVVLVLVVVAVNPTL